MYLFSGKDPGGHLEDPEAGVLRGWPCLKAMALYRRRFIREPFASQQRSEHRAPFSPLRSDDRAGSPGALPLEALHLEGLPQEELPLEERPQEPPR